MVGADNIRMDRPAADNLDDHKLDHLAVGVFSRQYRVHRTPKSCRPTEPEYWRHFQVQTEWHPVSFHQIDRGRLPRRPRSHADSIVSGSALRPERRPI